MGKVIALILCLWSFPIIVSAGIKCWTNHDGMRECGNVVPPEYAQKSHREFNQQGIMVKQTTRAKTKEEIEQERAEQARLAAEKAETERIAKDQAARDRILLDTFTTEDDLFLTRDGKLQAIEARIRHAKSRIDKLEQSLADLHAQAAMLERLGKPVPEALQREIANVEQQIGANRTFIEQYQSEQEEVRASFEADLQRLRELKRTSRSEARLNR